MHDKTNTQLKNKRLAALLHDVLEDAHTATPEKVEGMLVSILRYGKEIADSQVTADSDVDTNLRRVREFVSTFLQKASGGARLVAVTGAFTSLLSSEYTVKAYNPNVADKFAKTIGDIEVFTDEDTLIAAYECKQRPLNLDDVKHGIKKAKDAGVPEYCFVCSEGVQTGQERAIQKEIDSCEDLDVTLIHIADAAHYWIAMLNTERRGQFGEAVATLLRSMKRADVANEAAELWNSLE